MQRALLTPQANPGSLLYCCSKGNLRAVCGPGQEERSLTFAQKRSSQVKGNVKDLAEAVNELADGGDASEEVVALQGQLEELKAEVADMAVDVSLASFARDADHP